MRDPGIPLRVWINAGMLVAAAALIWGKLSMRGTERPGRLHREPPLSTPTGAA